MAIERGHYEGRYEALVKHTFLKGYIAALVNKVSFKRDTFVYVDGFAGPWKSADEKGFSDTSFGIALDALLAAQRTQLAQGRRVRMVAHLVEKDVAAFSQLEQLVQKYPTMEVNAYCGEFEVHLPTILQCLRDQDFCFSFIDPKGFGLDLDILKPLLSRSSSEVLVNFMYDHANRFASHPTQGVKDTINAMFLGSEWRERLDAAQAPSEREAIILEAFKIGLKEIGKYNFVTSLAVQKTFADRTYYHLVFGTRHSEGLAVFRDSQVKALKAQADVRASEKSKAKATRTGQDDLFGGADTIQQDASSKEIVKGKSGGADFAKHLVNERASGIVWSELWPAVLEHFTIRRSDLGNAMNAFRKSGEIEAPGWPSPRHRQPQDSQIFLPKSI
jgi:three-Cys-motif partner protein